MIVEKVPDEALLQQWCSKTKREIYLVQLLDQAQSVRVEWARSGGGRSTERQKQVGAPRRMIARGQVETICEKSEWVRRERRSPGRPRRVIITRTLDMRSQTTALINATSYPWSPDKRAYLTDTSARNLVRGETCNFTQQLQTDDRANGFWIAAQS